MKAQVIGSAFAMVMFWVGCTGEDKSDSGDTTAAALSGYTTCGDPACSGYSGPFDGVPLCSEVDSPSVGDECSEDGLTCDPVDDCNALVVCAAEDPKDQTGGCPISKAEHKSAIDYLSPEELAAVERELMAVKLARWHYTDESPDATRLGFLIDDVPGSPAVRPNGEQVDLYGYTSMAVAALQAQAAQIEALETRLKALETSCPQ